MTKKARHSVKTVKSRLSLHELALVKGSCQKFVVLFEKFNMAWEEGVEAKLVWTQTKRINKFFLLSKRGPGEQTVMYMYFKGAVSRYSVIFCAFFCASKKWRLLAQVSRTSI